MSEISALGIIFSRFEGIFKHFHPIACISRTPTLGQNLEEKSANYTQVYTVFTPKRPLPQHLECGLL